MGLIVKAIVWIFVKAITTCILLATVPAYAVRHVRGERFHWTLYLGIGILLYGAANAAYNFHQVHELVNANVLTPFVMFGAFGGWLMSTGAAKSR